MVGVVGVIVAFYLYADTCCGKLACKAVACAVVGFNLHPEVAVEGVFDGRGNGGSSLRCSVSQALHHALINILYKTVVAICCKIGHLSACKSEGKKFLNLRGFCSVLVENALNLLVHNLYFLNVLCF